MSNINVPDDLKDFLNQIASANEQQKEKTSENPVVKGRGKNKVSCGRVAAYSDREILCDMLKKRAEAMGGEDEDWIRSSEVRDDLKKISFGHREVNIGFSDNFSMPGFEPGYDELKENLVVMWCGARGYEDEIPVAFCVYIDNRGKLRAYIPNHGNVFNEFSKASYEIDECPNYSYNMEELRKDACSRITVDPKTIPETIDLTGKSKDEILDTLNKIAGNQSGTKPKKKTSNKKK